MTIKYFSLIAIFLLCFSCNEKIVAPSPAPFHQNLKYILNTSSIETDQFTHSTTNIGIDLITSFKTSDSIYNLQLSFYRTAVGTYSVSMSDHCAMGSGSYATGNLADTTILTGFSTCYGNLSSTYTIDRSDSIITGAFHFNLSDGIRSGKLDGTFQFKK